MSENPELQSHLAYLALESLIVTSQLKPGSLVTEKQLIDVTQQGRTPVREAIQKLAWQGLMAVRPRVGLQIADIRPQDFEHIMQTRRQLEPLAAHLVAQSASDKDRADLRACAQSMTDCAVTGDFIRFLNADKVFDEVMERACPNRFLTAALAPLQTHSRRLWFAHATQERMDRSIDLHVKVIRSIQQADASGAEAAITRLLDYLSEA
jgi:DNA-binding GntR family transcriptional regulator